MKRLSGVLNAIELNKPIVTKKQRLSVAIGILLPLLVASFILLATIPRI